MSKRQMRAPRHVPLDHLKPGGRESASGNGTVPAAANTERSSEPAAPTTPGGAATDAVSGKATRSPAEVATRRHLEGSEQGPA